MDMQAQTQAQTRTPPQTGTPKPARTRVVSRQVAWMGIVALALWLSGSLRPDLFALLSILGLFCIAQFTAPRHLTPPWRSRLGRVVTISVVGFFLLALWRLLEVVPVPVPIVG